jgi:hypothetical protein
MIGSHVRSSRITIPDFQPPFALTNDKIGLCLVNERGLVNSTSPRVIACECSYDARVWIQGGRGATDLGGQLDEAVDYGGQTESQGSSIMAWRVKFTGRS